MCKSKKLSLPNKKLEYSQLLTEQTPNPLHIKNSFHKQERLCSKKQMDLLFKEGKGFTSYPVKAVCNETPVDLIFPAQAMFVAPKRSFKRAHDRNKLKRRMREAYRLNKISFYEDLKLKNKKMLVAFIYIGKKQEEYPVIEKAILKLLTNVLKPAEK